MISLRALLRSIVIAGLVLGGCRGCGVDDEAVAHTDAAGPRPETCQPLDIPPDAGPAPSGPDALFVITSLRFGDEAAGLDLDCIDSPQGCPHDACREAPEDGPEGVDNRLGPLAMRISELAGSDLQREMSRAVKRGDHPLLLRIRRAGDLVDGRAEAVELSFGLPADDDQGDPHSGRVKVRPDPEGPSKRPSRFAPVVLRDGEVVAGPTTDWMPLFWTRGQIAAVPVEAAYIRFHIAEPPSGDPLLDGRIDGGMLAGAIRPQDLSSAILEMDRRTAKVLDRLSPIVRALIRRQADLDLIPGGVTGDSCRESRDCAPGQRCRAGQCFEPEGHLDSLSFGIHFTAASARQ